MLKSKAPDGPKKTLNTGGKLIMTYDFETLVSRKNMGSSKWMRMLEANPNVADDVVPLTMADMELKNPPELIEGHEAILGYSRPTAGYLDAVQSWMKRRHGWEIKKEWIAPSPGVVPAVYQAILAYTEPGEGIITMTPAYHCFFDAIRMNGRKLAASPLKLEGTRYEMDYEGLERLAADPNNKVMLLCSPYNPCSRVWSREELLRLCDICLRHDLLIISDEIHHDLIMPGYRHIPTASLSHEISLRTVTCTAPSKTFNLAGMQVSNIIIEDPALRKKFEDTLLSTGIDSLTILGYKSCELAYERCEEWLEQLLAHVHRNSELLIEYLSRELPQVKIIPLEGTYLQWLDCRALGLSYKELERTLRQEGQVFFDEGYIDGEDGQGFERVNLACPQRVLMETLERFVGCFKKQ